MKSNYWQKQGNINRDYEGNIVFIQTQTHKKITSISFSAAENG